ncbi:MAG: OB-fold protein [Chitinophagaceae bacterium]
MTDSTPSQTTANRIHLVAGILLLVTYFLPWVAWRQYNVTGYDLPAGNFFMISEEHFKLGNPFPKLAFTFYAFWLIPLFTLWGLAQSFNKNKSPLPAFMAGALVLSQATVYYLFSSTLADLGVGKSAVHMLQPGIIVATLSAVLFILSAFPVQIWLKKLAWILLGPVIAFTSYKMGEKAVMSETFTHTRDIHADYSISATDLLKEFAANDSAANAKYREKILVVSGKATQVEQRSDSTTTIQMADTTGSYVVFSFDKDQLQSVNHIKTGDAVSLKGACSGSVYSEILGITFISFKRSAIHKN